MKYKVINILVYFRVMNSIWAEGARGVLSHGAYTPYEIRNSILMAMVIKILMGDRRQNHLLFKKYF